MGIVASILDASTEAARRQGANRITEIRISVGELAEVVDFAIEFAFESLTPGTMAEGATLTVRHIGGRSRCPECDIEFEHGRFDVTCPQCGSFICELVAGRELLIDSIEVDTVDEAQVAGATPTIRHLAEDGTEREGQES